MIPVWQVVIALFVTLIYGLWIGTRVGRLEGRMEQLLDERKEHRMMPDSKTITRAEVRPCLEYLAYQGKHGAGSMAKVAQDILDGWRDENLEPAHERNTVDE